MSSKGRREETKRLRAKMKGRKLSDLIEEGQFSEFYMLNYQSQLIGGLIVGGGHSEEEG